MVSVLVTGGSGESVRSVCGELARRGHRVRLGTAGTQGLPPEVQVLDPEAGFDGIDAVIHLGVTRAGSDVGSFQDGLRKVLADAEAVGAHFVYLSRVGARSVRSRRYRSEDVAEKEVTKGATRWTIQRATDFHGEIDRLLTGTVAAKLPRLAYQPVDPADVAVRLVDLVEAGPSRRADDFGGPELLGIETLARRRERIMGSGCPLIRVPKIGKYRDLVRGRNLAPEHRSGTVTWNQWLRASAERV